MVVLEGIAYDEFVAHATRIDPALMKKEEREAKQKKKTTTSASTSSTVSKDSKSSTTQSTTQSASYRFRLTSFSKPSSPARKPALKELKPEVSRQEADRRGLCRNCNERDVRHDCPKFQQSRQQPATNAISIIPPETTLSRFDQVRLRTANKVRQEYAVKETGSYRDAALGQPKLEAPSWSVDTKIAISAPDHQDLSHSSTSESPSLPRLEEPFVRRIRINSAEARFLVDTGASGNFVSSHFTFVDFLKHRLCDSHPAGCQGFAAEM